MKAILYFHGHIQFYIDFLFDYSAKMEIKQWHTENDLRPNHHNTCTDIIEMYDDWLKAAEDKELSGSLLLDLSAAYDHSIILQKL